jgi:hypothetical protein
MGGSCVTHEGRGKLTERDHLEDLRIDGRIILKLILNKLILEGVDWVHVFQDRTRDRVL